MFCEAGREALLGLALEARLIMLSYNACSHQRQIVNPSTDMHHHAHVEGLNSAGYQE